MTSRSERAAKNVVVSVAMQLLGWCLSFVLTLFVPRYLGSAGLGEMGTAGAFVAVFGVAVSLGTSPAIVKLVARDRARVPELLSAGLALRIPFAFLVAAALIVISRFSGYSILIQELIIAFAVVMVIGSGNDLISAVLQGQERIARQATIALIEKALASAATIAIILLHGSILEIALVGAVTGLFSLVMNLSSVREPLVNIRLPSREQIMSLGKAGLPFLGWGIFQTLYGQTDPLVLKYVSNNTTVGWYAASFRLIGMTLFFPTAVASALMPTLAALHHEDKQIQFRSLARMLLTVNLVLAMPFAVIFLCLPGELIGLLHYPADFLGCIPVLRVAAFGIMLYFMAVAVGTTVITCDLQATMLRASVVATVVGVPACFAFSRLFGQMTSSIFGGSNAAVGAMVSDVLLEVMLISFYLHALPRGLFGIETLLSAGRVILAGAPMAIILTLPFGRTGGLLVLVPAVGTYIVSCFVLKCVDADVLRALFASLRRKSQGTAVSEVTSGTGV